MLLRNTFILICLSALYSGCFNTGSKKTDKTLVNPELIALTDSILLYFQQERFDKIVRHFDDNVMQRLNKEQLAVLWAQLNSQLGKYTKGEFYGIETIMAIGDRVVYQCFFGSQKVYFQLVFGKDNKVTGIYFKPQPN